MTWSFAAGRVWRCLMLGHFAAISATIGLLGSGCPATGAAVPPERPNVVFILSDDLGYGDLGCYGSRSIRTPAIDRLAAEGVRLTHFYSNGPDCSPTRAGFLTGRYQHRVGGLECAIGIGGVGRYDDAARLAKTHQLGLPVTETSIARMLKDTGYDTGIIGKWHLGYEPEFSPNRHGFDYAFYVLGGGVDYFYHCEPNGNPVLRLNEQPIRRSGYFTDLVTDEAIRFIHREADKPFFLYVPYTAPHTPYQGPGDASPQPLPENSELYDQGKGSAKTYRAIVERLDEGVGRIVTALKEKELLDRTLVVFASDNGATQSGSTGGLSGFKGQTFEGGIRVPGIVRWPGGGIPRGVVSDQASMTMDFSASIVRVAGAHAPRPLDGFDIVGHLQSGVPSVDRTLFWRGRRGVRTWSAVRAGALKYVRLIDGSKTQEHLFDLARDPAETSDLLAQRPGEVQRLEALLAAWEQEVKPTR